jgi:PKD repeat protein
MQVTDHAPATFYAAGKTVISSSYAISKDRITFSLEDYDKSRIVIIDPWVVNPNFTDQNKAFDIACDSMGYVYVFGGHAPWKLKKFDQNGNLLWTYNTSFNDWYGALAVDLKGNSYITDGCCSGTIQQIDSAGNVGWTNVNGVDEYWRLAFSCDFSQLAICTGYSSGGFVPAESVSLLDTATGALGSSVTPFSPGTSEPRYLAWGINGNIFSVSCTSDEVAQITPAFTTIFTVPSSFILLYNGPLYSNGSNTTSGQNGISAGNNFFCTSNGSTLNKCDLNTGSVISSVLIPGGFTEGNSGLLVDNCENIFAGSSNAVIRFDPALGVVSTIPVPGAVYCMSPGKNGDLLVCGDGFIAAMGLSICRSIFCSNTSGSLPVALFSAPNHICPGTCTDFTNNSTNATNFQWSFPGGVPFSSTDAAPQGICYNSPGSYSVSLIATNINGSDTLMLNNYVVVYPYPPPQGITQHGDTLFANTGAVSYQWYFNGIIISGATGYYYIASASGNYNVVATDVNGCEVEAVIFDVIASVPLGTGSGPRAIFPNPGRDKITIHIPKAAGTQVTSGTAGEISIYNTIGKVVLAVSLPAAYSTLPIEVDIHTLSCGMYILELSSDGKIFRQKFVKE